MGAAHDTDAIVVGAGVIGLAVGRALARADREVLVLEREAAAGTHTSARNSEVIHAGIYYTPGSWKARLCVAGRRTLYDYAAAHQIAHQRLGKLIVATAADEVPALEQYHQRALTNGVEGLSWLDEDEVRALEPEVRCVRALHSSVTGIIDSHGLMQALRGDLEAAGGRVVLRAPVVGVRAEAEGFAVTVAGADATTVRCASLVNAAGLWAPEVAGTIEGLSAALVPQAHFAKGHYFTLAGPSPFRRLVYPVAVAGGLGIHVTLDLAGAARFGPDVAWIDGVDYAFDDSRAPAFEAAIRRYWPGLAPGRLRPGYTGVRPKLGPAGSFAQDFLIQGPGDHGLAGLINLFGMESPGLTAALAIADEVLARLAG